MNNNSYRNVNEKEKKESSPYSPSGKHVHEKLNEKSVISNIVSKKIGLTDLSMNEYIILSQIWIRNNKS